MHSLQAPAYSSADSVVVQVQSSVDMFEPCPAPSPMTMQGGTRIRRHCCHSRDSKSICRIMPSSGTSTGSTTAVVGTCSCRLSQLVMINQLYPSIPAATFNDGVGIGVTPQWGTI